MKRTSYITFGIVLSLFTATTVVASTVAWFKDGIDIGINGDQANASGAIEASLFGGDSSQSNWGTEDNPYLIQNKNHLYNLAWMQYMGYFNTALDENGKPTTTPLIQQKYFKLDVTDSLDMEGMVLPPIGTETFPFYSTFDGNGKTIENLVICNDDPRNDNSAFGINKPTPVSIIPNFAHRPRTLGFFGAVGYIPTCDFAGATEEICSSYVPVIENVSINNLTIRSKTNEILVGLAAGYVNGNMSGVKVGHSSIIINNCRPISDTFDNLSDYSLVGFVKDADGAPKLNKNISSLYRKRIEGGQEGGFGASINFKDYNNWFYELHKTKNYDLGSSAKAGDIGYMVSMGSSSTNSKRYNEKYGNDYAAVFNVATTQLISDPNSSFSITYYVTSPYRAVIFNFYGDSSGLYEEYTSTSPLYTQNFTWSTNNQTGANRRYLVDFVTGFSTFGNQKQFDFKATSSTENTFRVYQRGTTTYVVTWQFNKTADHVYRMVDGSYLPLKFNSDKSGVDYQNSGYIVGTGLVSDTNYVGAGSPRISSYSSSFLSGSLSGNKITSVQTYEGGSWKTITETKDSDGTITGVSNISFLSGKYADARNDVGASIEGQDTIHGIHFDVHTSNKYSGTNTYRGAISGADSASVTKNVHLKSYGENVSKSTKMPKGSIDFELNDSGFITFFAGLYTETDVSSMNFFSLFVVDRTNPTSYTLKEIRKIYKSSVWSENNPSYVYHYYNENEPSDKGDLVFDVETALWTPRTKDNSLYYFEIPVNGGEYVMGAVDQVHTNNTAYQGAYMMYLDLGTRGKQLGDSSMSGYSVTTQSNGTLYPHGVDFDVDGIGNQGGKTVSLLIPANGTGVISGSIIFSVETSGADVDINTDDIITKYMFKSDDIVVNSSGNLTPGVISGSSGGGYRIIRATVNEADINNWIIEVRQNLDENGEVSGSLEKISITCNNVSKEINQLPDIFIDNIVHFYDVVAVDISCPFGSDDFSLTADYSGVGDRQISIKIPADELGSTQFDVDVLAGYSCTIATINGDSSTIIYPTGS